MPAKPIPKENARAAQRTAISVRNLRVNYGEREILHGINFEVPAGETLVILGGSGSGKSTLLRTLVGLERPSGGEIWIRGQEFCGDARDRARRTAQENGHVVSRRRAFRLHDRRR